MTYKHFDGIIDNVCTRRVSAKFFQRKLTLQTFKKGEIFLLKNLKKIIATTLIFASLCVSASASELSSWAKDDYLNANYAQIIPFSVGSKSMNKEITREELCELIVNTYKELSKKDVPQFTENPFVDCDNQTVINAYGVGLVGGTGSDTFSPDNSVTREEMAKMIYNMLAAANLDIKLSTKDDKVFNEYADADSVNDWAKAAVSTMINYSLMTGIDGKIAPQNYATREQAIIAVSRAYKTFKTEKTLLANTEVTIAAPVEQSTVSNADVPVVWNSVDKACAYRIILRTANGDVLSVNETTATTYLIPKNMFTIGEYHITVSAVMDDGKEIFSVPVSINYVNPSLQALILAQGENAGMQNFDAPQLSSNVQVANITSPLVASIFIEAEKHLGTPYRYGGTTPAGFDCSGFVQYVFKNNGITLKRTSRDQYASNGRSISKDELRPGDLVFFGSGGTVGHVGIYAGNGQMIHSPSTGKSITYTSIESNYYLTHYMGAKRVIE